MVLALVAVTFIAYQPVWHAGFIWDDDAHVTANASLRSVEGLKQIWFEPRASQQYYPLQLTTYWLEYQLWGLHPVGYHLVNIWLHALNAVLIWQILKRLEVPGAWLAAAIFAVHPVEVESVAWVSERKNVLSATFYLLAMLAYFRFRLSKDGQRDWRFYALAILLFLCALLSKTVTCSLPAALVLLIWWKKGRCEKVDIWALAPLFVLGAGLGLTTAWLEKHHAGAGMDWSLSFVQRCLLAGRALWFYAGKLVWPYPLIFLYPRWEIDARQWWQWLFPLATVAVVITLWARRCRGALVAVLLFAGTLFPALGFFDVYPFRYSFVADHFQYLASVALISLVVAAAVWSLEKSRRVPLMLHRLIWILVLAALFVLTRQQSGIYTSAETLYRATIARNPSCWMAYNNLGGLLLEQGRLAEAEEALQQALRFKADDGGVYNNLGTGLFRQRRFVEAATQYREAVRLNPDYAEAHFNLGNTVSELGQLDEAVTQYRRAIELEGDYAEAHYNLGNTLLRQNKPAPAIEHYRAAAHLRPGDADAQYSLASVLAQQGELVEAVARYQRALQIKPDHAAAHYNLANALFQLDQPREAADHYREALRLQPDLLAAEFNLATALLSLGNTREAIEHLQRAVTLKPDLAEAHSKLGAAFAKLTEFDNATNAFGRALQLKADLTDAQADLAWLLVTRPGATALDVQRAAVLATRACQMTANQNPAFLDTRAAAYAAAGQFSQAIETAGQAETLAAKSGAAELTRQIQSRRDLYRNGRTYQAAVMTPLPSDW